MTLKVIRVERGGEGDSNFAVNFTSIPSLDEPLNIFEYWEKWAFEYYYIEWDVVVVA